MRELADKDSEDGVFKMLSSDVTRFLTTILIGTTYSSFYAITLTSSISIFLFRFSLKVFLIVDFIYLLRVVNIGATALVTDAATAIFGEAGVSAATGVMTVCINIFFLDFFLGLCCDFGMHAIFVFLIS